MQMDLKKIDQKKNLQIWKIFKKELVNDEYRSTCINSFAKRGSKIQLL